MAVPSAAASVRATSPAADSTVLPCSFNCGQRGLHLVKRGVRVKVLETLHSRPKVIDVVA